MHLGQVSCYGILFATNPVARAMSMSSKAHMGAAKYILRYLAGSVNFSTTYKRGRFEIAAYSDAYWGNNLDNGKSTSPYTVMLANGPISFEVGL